MKELVYGIILLSIAGFIYEIIHSILKTKRCNELTDCLIKKDDNRFNELISDNSTKKILSINDIYSFKLAEAIQYDKDKKVRNLIDEASKTKMKSDQKSFLFEKAFFYFYSKKDYKNVSLCYKYLKDLSNYKISKQINIIVNTFIDGKADYLDYMLDMLNNESDKNKKLEYINYILRMYENIGDTNNRNKYITIAKQLIEQ